ncbi:short chain dehydrogenase [Colletotrichum sublineola]|uniref:Putative short chain dehydrogenase n=1 Tax=Colletotrichum sublineola TaxID=1173701 RepID=A0A066XW04_COLSU|nr:short chain dehydrogenase [Colletotrichum sublineola]KDN71869.1 putative short chain dehydrogenase [Colletotrichum sublineola]
MSSKKIILVTGANQGIGYDTSVALASASPNNHVIIGSRSQERGAKAVEDIRARNPAGTVSLLQLDVTSDDSIKAAVDSLTAEFGVLDVLVNNAGIVITQPKDRRSELLDTFNTNAAGALILAEALVPLLKKSKDPRIINVSSGLGSISQRTDPGSKYYEVGAVSYRISKAALNMATAHMAYDFKSWGAKVWAYCPGYVVTNLTGENDRQRRIESGADSAETSAQGILEIVEGKRDGEVGKFITRYGGQYSW